MFDGVLHGEDLGSCWFQSVSIIFPAGPKTISLGQIMVNRLFCQATMPLGMELLKAVQALADLNMGSHHPLNLSQHR